MSRGEVHSRLVGETQFVEKAEQYFEDVLPRLRPVTEAIIAAPQDVQMGDAEEITLDLSMGLDAQSRLAIFQIGSKANESGRQMEEQFELK